MRPDLPERLFTPAARERLAAVATVGTDLERAPRCC